MNEYAQKRLENAILEIIKSRVGVENAISSREIVKELRRLGFDGVPDLLRTIRQIISDHRRNEKPICSKMGIGYFWPNNYREIIETAGSLEHRAKEMLVTAKLIKESGGRLFGFQTSFLD